MNEEKTEDILQIVGPKNTFPKVALVDPTNSGYLLFALEIDLIVIYPQHSVICPQHSQWLVVG